MAGTGNAARGDRRLAIGRDVLELRRARRTEAGFLSQLCLRSKAVWGYDRAFLEKCRRELSVGMAAIDAGLVQLALRGGTVCGLAEISVRGPIGYLEKLFVEPDWIGTGTGTLLFAWACSEAGQRGCAEMLVEADPAAEAFYLAMGCVPDGYARSQSISGRNLPRLRLALKKPADSAPQSDVR